MEVNCENRNCYNYGRFGHIVKHCRNREIRNRIGEGKRLEYRNGNNEQRRIIKEGNRQNNNLSRYRDLIVLNEVSVIIGMQCSLE